MRVGSIQGAPKYSSLPEAAKFHHLPTRCDTIASARQRNCNPFRIFSSFFRVVYRFFQGPPPIPPLNLYDLDAVLLASRTDPFHVLEAFLEYILSAQFDAMDPQNPIYRFFRSWKGNPLRVFPYYPKDRSSRQELVVLINGCVEKMIFTEIELALRGRIIEGSLSDAEALLLGMSKKEWQKFPKKTEDLTGLWDSYQQMKRKQEEFDKGFIRFLHAVRTHDPNNHFLSDLETRTLSVFNERGITTLGSFIDRLLAGRDVTLLSFRGEFQHWADLLRDEKNLGYLRYGKFGALIEKLQAIFSNEYLNPVEEEIPSPLHILISNIAQIFRPMRRP